MVTVFMIDLLVQTFTKYVNFNFRIAKQIVEFRKNNTLGNFKNQ